MNTQTTTEHTVQFVDRLRSEAAEPLEPISTKEVTKETQIIAIYGKGGIGKSFTLANLSYMMAQQGKKFCSLVAILRAILPVCCLVARLAPPSLKLLHV